MINFKNILGEVNLETEKIGKRRFAIAHPVKPKQNHSLPQQADSKKVYIEFLRIIAAFLVIVNHTNSRLFLSIAPSPTWFSSLTYFFICKTAVPIFLFVMGALLLKKEDTPAKTRSRLLRIFVVFVVASLGYYTFYSYRSQTEFSIKEFLINLPKTPSTNAFWYLYLYLALLCMLPILQRLVKALDKKLLQYLLVISLCISGTVPLISILFPNFQLSGNFTAGLIGVYIGQVLLGYYIEQYLPLTKKVFWGAFCSFVLLIALQVGGTYLLYQKNPSSYLSLDNRVLITITASSAAVYICIKYIFASHTPSAKLSKAICSLGALSFGIYLLGDMVISLTTPLYSVLCAHIPNMIAMVLWEVYIFAVCALVTFFLRLIPFIRKWL